MNNPFYYTPSARCEEAVSSLLEIIRFHPEWNEEVRGGKTFGVLITESETLFAYSGQMLGRYDIEGFVPPVFDYLDKKGYFKIHEAEIVNINKEIDRLSTSDELHQAREALYDAEKAKPILPPSRNIDPASEEYEAYCRERQFEKGEYRRHKAVWNERIAECRNALQTIQDRITSLKQERKHKSDCGADPAPKRSGRENSCDKPPSDRQQNGQDKHQRGIEQHARCGGFHHDPIADFRLRAVFGFGSDLPSASHQRTDRATVPFAHFMASLAGRSPFGLHRGDASVQFNNRSRGFHPVLQIVSSWQARRANRPRPRW